MEIDLESYFEKYRAIVAQADAAFAKVKQDFASCVKCKITCVDCCHALFDLTLIEALYLNYHCNRTITGKDRETLIERSNRADRKVYRVKRKAYQALKEGKKEADILEDLAVERVRCPLLNEEDRCDLYEHRPITCRIYGIPTSIGGRGHTCGVSAFVEGKPYPTVNLDRIQQMLFDLSAELVRDIRSRHLKMSEVLVPVSMAVLTDYDDAYLGIDSDEERDSKE
jgi:Fe-S-cluster containining protein